MRTAETLTLHTRALLWDIRQQISEAHDGIRWLTSQSPTWACGEPVSEWDRRAILRTLRERMRQDESFARYLLRKMYASRRA
jgi:hypothetical protein